MNPIPMADENIIKLRGITKRFSNVIANDNIDFTLRKGEIHALLGENGAGKSTLMNILAGLYRPDSGKIFVKGKEVQFKSPKDSINAGIGMIHQHFMLVQAHTVLDNIILGTLLPFILNRKKLAEEISSFAKKHHFDIDLTARIWQLSVGEQQKVEIVKTLYKGAQILILDEPTSVLTPPESKHLFRILRRMKNDGYSIIFISHKLEEVLSISDRITILRKGKVVDTVHNESLQKTELARLMVGKEVLFDISNESKVKSEKEVLRIENITAKNDRELKVLDNLSLTVHAGEILGIAGVAGNGQSELAEVSCGLRKIESGSIYISGQNIRGKTVKDIINLGVGYIPEDRIGVASVGNLDIKDNIRLKCYDVFSFFSQKEINHYSEHLVKKFDVVSSSLSTPVKYLSGGNLQKLILARELSEVPKLLIAVYPTRGLDIGAIEFVRNILLDCRNQGSAILLMSEDLDELFSISDAIAVIYEGKLTIMETTNVNQIGLAIAGSRDEDEED